MGCIAFCLWDKEKKKRTKKKKKTNNNRYNVGFTNLLLLVAIWKEKKKKKDLFITVQFLLQYKDRHMHVFTPGAFKTFYKDSNVTACLLELGKAPENHHG